MFIAIINFTSKENNSFSAARNLHTTGTCTKLYYRVSYKALRLEKKSWKRKRKLYLKNVGLKWTFGTQLKNDTPV